MVVFKELLDIKDVERNMESCPAARTMQVIFPVAQLWLQLSAVLMLCSLVAGVRLGPDYQVHFGGADPTGCAQLPLGTLVLFAQCLSLMPIFRPQC